MTTINFNFYINGNQASLGGALAAALAGGFEAFTDEVKPAVTSASQGELFNPVPAAAPVAAEKPLAQRIIDVLNDKSKYRKRSLKAIAKATGASEADVDDELDTLVDDGDVRQSDYSGLYYV